VLPQPHKRGELLGLLERVQGEALEVDEHEAIVRAVVDTFIERQR
jgi:hypothetical protein